VNPQAGGQAPTVVPVSFNLGEPRQRLRAVLRDPAGDAIGVQGLRYLIIGGMGYVLAVGAYAVLLAIDTPPYAAVIAVFVLNGMFNFLAMRAWAFPASGRRVHSEVARFCAVAGASLVINYSSFAVLYSVLGVPALIAQALAIIIAAPAGFLANRRWSFG
jgi:putative flippase GtrA